MDNPDPRPSVALEGRMLAHRRLLVLLLQSLPAPRQAELAEWLADRSIPRDGQEDPGAVPSEAGAIDLALTDEFRLLAEMLSQSQPPS
ncbi:hypothetical protein [Tabrizicola sp.]|uniref:hypothetical protein n=1 Tax=Tabrizicola sp. TaxID=2005166 RepID=UPI0035AF08FC